MAFSILPIVMAVQAEMMQALQLFGGLTCNQALQWPIFELKNLPGSTTLLLQKTVLFTPHNPVTWGKIPIPKPGVYGKSHRKEIFLYLPWENLSTFQTALQ